MGDFTYDAFVSYRRSDGARQARWLRRTLEGFRPPRQLRAKYDRKLRIYLDTVYERGTIDFYRENIQPALLASRFLLVLATPDAKRRPEGVEDWMVRELTDFTAGPNGGNVIAVRGAGEFDDPLPADLAARFPNIEIVDLRGASRFASLNPARAARLTAEKLKLIAPLLGLPEEEMPRLRREEEHRYQARLGSAVGTTLGIFIAISGLSVYALQSRNQAVRALEDSLFSTGRMVLQSEQLTADPKDPNTDTRRLLINQGCDLIDKLSQESGQPALIAEFVTCRLERAASYAELSEFDKARGQYAEAIATASARYAHTARTDSALAIIKARSALVDFLVGRNDLATAETELTALADDAARFARDRKDRSEFPLAQGDALGRLGSIYDEQQNWAKGGDTYIAAAAAATAALDMSGDEKTPATVDWVMRLYRLAGEDRMRLNDAVGALDHFTRSLAARDLLGEAVIAPVVEIAAAEARARIFLVERSRGNADTANEAFHAAITGLDKVLAAPNLAAAAKTRAETLKAQLGKLVASN